VDVGGAAVAVEGGGVVEAGAYPGFFDGFGFGVGDGDGGGVDGGGDGVSSGGVDGAGVDGGVDGDFGFAPCSPRTPRPTANLCVPATARPGGIPAVIAGL